MVKGRKERRKKGMEKKEHVLARAHKSIRNEYAPNEYVRIPPSARFGRTVFISHPSPQNPKT
jgi:hypothetical protein